MSNDVERLKKLSEALKPGVKNDFFSGIFQEFQGVKLHKQDQDATLKKIEKEYAVRVKVGEGIAR